MLVIFFCRRVVCVSGALLRDKEYPMIESKEMTGVDFIKDNADWKSEFHRLIWNLIKRLLALIPAESDLLEKNRNLLQDNKKQKRSHIISGIIIFLLLLILELLRWMVKLEYL